MNQNKQRARLSRSVKLDLWSALFFIGAGLTALSMEAERPMNVPLFLVFIALGVLFLVWSGVVRYKKGC